MTAVSVKREAQPVRLTQLDALRGVAALMVVFFHYTSRFAEVYPHQPQSGLRFDIGEFGVDFFFILSGFVIFLSLQRCSSVWEFARLRFWRLFPVYWAAVLFSAAMIWLLDAPGQAEGLDVPVVVLNLAMVHQFFYVPNVDGVYWTLAYEFAFYVWAACLYFIVPKRFTEWLLVAYVALAAGLTLFARQRGVEVPYRLTMALMLDYAQLFSAGIVLYHVRSAGLTWTRGAMLVFFVLVEGYMHGLSAMIVTTLVVLMILEVLRGRLRWLNTPVMLFFGAISYSLYLVHQSFGHSLMFHLGNAGVPAPLAALLALVLSIAVAACLTYLIERPVLRRVRRGRNAGRTRQAPRRVIRRFASES
ncbi:acyltransferase [Granulosicoccaceae sp. 1_MG-2023]|nr:acyltransferase [Granulosicoccaceae sp. 1_MG-2023]